MLHRKTFLSLAIVATVVFLASCSKNGSSNVNYTTLGTETSVAENYSNSVYTEVDNQAKSSSNGIYNKTAWNSAAASVTGTCANITVSSGAFPKTVLIDYGSGCPDIYGITRKGQITAVFTGFYGDSGTIVTITSTNYQQSTPGAPTNLYQYSGTKVITNIGHLDGNPAFTVADNNVHITQPSGKVILWSTQRTNEWTAGSSTPFNILDDVYAIRGYATGTTSDGTGFRIDITTARPLIYDVICPYLVSGEVTYTVNGSQVATEEFAQNGSCIYGAADTLHYNSSTYVIKYY